MRKRRRYTAGRREVERNRGTKPNVKRQRDQGGKGGKKETRRNVCSVRAGPLRRRQAQGQRRGWWEAGPFGGGVEGGASGRVR